MRNWLQTRFEEAPHRQRRELTFKAHIKQSRHGWLRLTPAYSLHLVGEVMADFDPARDFVLDPFSGTATTTLVSAAAGIRAHSVDINPFLIWLGNLKLTEFAPDDAALARKEGRRIIRALKGRKTWGSAWTPNLHQIEKWWDPPVLAVLAQLYEYVTRADDARDLLRIAYCKVMIEVSHASFRHQSMSFKQRDSGNGNRALFPQAAPDVSDVCGRFAEAVERVAEDSQRDQPTVEARVFLGDSRNLAQVLPRTDYTRVVTSPPYPNRMSYIRELRPYMYWLGFLTSGRQAGDLDWEAIGGTWGCATSNLAKWKPNPGIVVPFNGFEKVVARIAADHPLLGNYVARYFEDMRLHTLSLDAVLTPGAEVYYVVGNSKFYGTLLHVEDIFAALFEVLGYERVAVEKIRKRSSKKELYEFLVRAKKPG